MRKRDILYLITVPQPPWTKDADKVSLEFGALVQLLALHELPVIGIVRTSGQLE
jgi:hypothetical protein